jgi:pyridoxal phosphate enzyme (YggS family)
MTTVATALEAVQGRIAAAARRAGRAPENVRLVGVTKTHPAELVAQVIAAGLRDIGENRVQEAEAKIAALADQRAAGTAATWHLIGHLQTNKARRAAALFDVIQTVDSLRVAQALDRAAAELGRVLPVLLQVNIAGEASKEGFAMAGWAERAPQFEAFVQAAEQIGALEHVRVDGLMMIPPWGSVPEASRPYFREMRVLQERLAQRLPHVSWDTLSMGMSGDFEVAIEEGATIVRVGRALFGERATAGPGG